MKTLFRVLRVTSLIIFRSCGTDGSFLNECGTDLFFRHCAIFSEIFPCGLRVPLHFNNCFWPGKKVWRFQSSFFGLKWVFDLCRAIYISEKVCSNNMGSACLDQSGVNSSYCDNQTTTASCSSGPHTPASVSHEYLTPQPPLPAPFTAQTSTGAAGAQTGLAHVTD